VPFSDEDLERLQELAGLAELGSEIDDAMDRLPPGLGDAVALRVIDELPYAQVAHHLSITPQAARVRVSRALCTLRAAISNDRGTP